MKPVTTGYDPTTYKLLTFHDAVADFRNGDDNPRAYLERCTETIEAREPEVKAFVTLNPTGAREAADASAERYRRDRPLSLVDGMPIGVKDLYETADMPTQMGSPLFAGWHTHRDSAAVYALRQSGAVIIGKTVTTEFGFYDPGPTSNPFDSGRTPGGSSSGSAAAVGARMVPAAIGSQVVGSIIRPASYCGNIALKPSIGALSKAGGHSSLSQSCLGVHGGSLADVWAVAHLIGSVAGGDPGYPGLFGEPALSVAYRPARLIRLETAGWPEAEEASRAKFDDVLVRLVGHGVTVLAKGDDPRIAAFEDAIEAARDVSHDVCGYELRWPLKTYRDRGPDSLGEDLRNRLDVWDRLTVEDYRRALARREDMRRHLAALADVGDALITLPATGAAPRGLSRTGDPIFAVPASILGAPAISLPLLEIEGMPLGVQLIGYRDGDARLMGIANWMMRTLGGAQ